MNTTNYINRIFFDLKVLKEDVKREHISSAAMKYWICQCLICNQISSYSSQGLVARKKSGCPQCKKILPIGQKYNRLTIKQYLGRIKNEPRHYYLCECECGNTIIATLKSLKNNNTKSCGCLTKETRIKNLQKSLQKQCKDLTGIKRGLLTIERLATPEEIMNRPKNCRYWKAKCECGNYHIVGTSDFLGGKVQSCGCLLSKGEQKITQLLTNNNILFVKQYTFSDLRGLKNTYYSFDFGIVDENNKLKYLIEYDGRQHTDSSFQFAEGDYEKIQIRDANKNEYCSKHNIPLIRIPYTHFEKLTIDDLKLETSSFIFDFN